MSLKSDKFDPKQLGRNIKHYRKPLFPRQIDLAEKLSMSKAAIESWEQGKNSPSVARLVQMRNMFCCTMQELLKNTNFFSEEE